MPGPGGHHSHGNTPTGVLRDEHDVILRALATLEVQLERISAGAPPEVQDLRHTVDFLRGFADKRHHGKEEDLLFPALEEAGLPREGGPVGIMLEEHVQGREYIRGIAEGLDGLDSDAGRARTRILDNGWAYIQLLRAHIHKENEILFRMAEEMLDADTLHGLIHRFEDVEASLGEAERVRHLEIVARLESKTGLAP